MRPGWLSVLVILALSILLCQNALALALQPAQTWSGGVFDDAPQADTPGVPSDIVLPPGIASCPWTPFVVVGRLPAGLELHVSSLSLDASLGRAPPLA